MKALLNKLFRKRYQSVYGPNIFKQQSWLDRQVSEALRKETLNRTLGIR